jgi:hypothetical protein
MKSLAVHSCHQESTQIDSNRHFSTPIGAVCTQFRRVIGGRHAYWNIKGWGHFVVFFWFKRFRFLGFAWYHFDQKVVPPWYRS